MDESAVETFYNLVFPEIEDNQLFSGQKTGLMIFMKDVIKRGLQSYESDNSV
jgi:hypothetical protein